MALPIEVRNLTRYYGEHRGNYQLNFDVDEGEVFGFLGPNGAGKTTFIRQLMGILKPSSGEARIFGHDCWEERAETKRYIGYLPSDITYYDRMTGRQLLEFFGAFRPGSGYRDRIEPIADRFKLDLDRNIHQLSSGNRQKVGIILAVMHDPPLLIFDEPTAGLDPLMRQEFLNLVIEEHQRGRTIFLSSHDLYEVESVATRVGIIREAELVAVEPIDVLRERRQRKMTVVLGSCAPVAPLEALEAVERVVVHEDGLNLDLYVKSPIKEVLRVLGEMPVIDMVYGPADLQSIFLHYYDGSDDQLEDEERQ